MRYLLTTLTAVLVVSLFAMPSAYAGVWELSASYGTHTSLIDQNNYTTDEEITGAMAWYFLSRSALEASYTYGYGEQSLEAVGDPGATIYYQIAEMIGLDLELSLTPTTSLIQPFIRAGGLHLFKKMYEEFYDGSIYQYGSTVNTIVPSYGVGVNIHLTQTFAVHASYDRWESGVDGQSGIWDDAIRAGVSWFF